MHTQKNFDQLLIFVNLYQHAKNLKKSSICSADEVDLKIWQSDWLRAFWPTSKKYDFSQIWDLFKNTANSVQKEEITEQIQ